MGITKLINIVPVPILMMKIVISAEHDAIATLTKQNSVNKRNHKVYDKLAMDTWRWLLKATAGRTVEEPILSDCPDSKHHFKTSLYPTTEMKTLDQHLHCDFKTPCTASQITSANNYACFNFVWIGTEYLELSLSGTSNVKTT